MPPRHLHTCTVWTFACGCVWTWDRVSRRREPADACAGHRVPGPWGEWERQLEET